MSATPYSRVYWTVMDDPKFDGVREDPKLLGSWLLMLLVADMSWPAPAFVPPVVQRSAVARLAACGLIDPLDGQRYRVHGLASEREKRAQTARNAAAVRWHSDGNAKDVLDEEEAETRKETRRDSPPSPHEGRRANATNGRAVGSNPRARGASPRQERKAEKRAGMPLAVSELLRRATEGQP